MLIRLQQKKKIKKKSQLLICSLAKCATKHKQTQTHTHTKTVAELFRQIKNKKQKTRINKKVKKKRIYYMYKQAYTQSA